jgi:hypothetical protein
VWRAFSDLFLDTELQETDFQFIARVLLESRYTEEELEAILYREVFPVCIWNVRSIVGEWAGFNEDWLQKQILGNARKFWKGWRIFQPDRYMVRDEWESEVVDERRNCENMITCLFRADIQHLSLRVSVHQRRT